MQKMREARRYTTLASGEAEHADVALGPTQAAPNAGTVASGTSEPCGEAFRVSLTSGLVAPGTQLGRYVILHRVGEGGMGVVYTAYDPQLDRRIALKFLHPGESSRDSEARDRLRREAQAMARLSHPNVVTVHDAGEFDGVVFISMEYVDGDSLRDWMDQGSRRWQDVLDVFLSAGEGLAAAHDAGLVHRDFKMENVLIDRQGRPRVGDFGIARPVQSPADKPVEAPAAGANVSGSPPGLLHTPLTAQGGILGTPGFMAPEQMDGRALDPRSDQFSYCICLYESLWGRRPFEGSTLPALLASIQRGPAPPPKDGRIPARVREAVLRGLAALPSDRHSSMRALLDALRPRQSRRATTAWVLVTLSLVLSAASALGAWWLNPRRAPLCRGAERRLEGVWDEPRKRQVKEVFSSANKPFSTDAWRAVSDGIDAYSTAWTTAHQEACEATRVRGEQSEKAMDQRMICMERRLQHLRALTSILAAANDDVLAHAVDAVQSLPSIETCSDIEALSSPVPMPSNQTSRNKLADVRAKIAQAKALFDVGDSRKSLEISSKLAEDVKGLQHAPTESEVQYVLGLAQHEMGEYKQAEAAFTQAATRAIAGQTNELLVDALAMRAFVAGLRFARYEEGDGWNRLAEAAAERLVRNEELAGSVENTFGALDTARGKNQEALVHFDRAGQLFQKVLPAGHMRLARLEINKGIVTSRLGRHEEAIHHHQNALAMLESLVGPRHPHVADALMNLGVSYRRAERLDEALTHYQRARSIQVDLTGPDNVKTLAVENNTAVIYGRQGRFQDALDTHDKVRLGRERTYGPNHPLVAASYVNMCLMQTRLGELDHALASCRVAIRINEKILGPDHRTTANARVAEGEVLRLKKRLADSLAAEQLAVAAMENDEQTPQNDKAEALLGLAKTLLDLGQGPRALPLAERAVKLLEGGDSVPTDVAEAKWILARALWDGGGDRLRAVEMASSAQHALAGAGPAHQDLCRILNAWMAAHPRP